MRLDAYTGLLTLHLLAVTIWIGHMTFWSLVVGPVCNRIDPPEEGRRLRVAAARFGGLGWPALAVLFATGIALLYLRGVLDEGGEAALLHTSAGRLMLVKLTLVAAMVAYQWLVGHRPAPRWIYANMLAAAAIVSLSVVIGHPAR